MAEVVDGELRLEAALVPGQRGRHDPSVVDEEVQRAPGGQVSIGEGIDRRRVDQVHRGDLHVAEVLLGGAGASDVACRDHDLGTGSAQDADRLPADAGVAAGDDRDRAGQVDAAITSAAVDAGPKPEFKACCSEGS